MHSVHSMITTHHQRYLYNFVNCYSYHVVILGTVSGQLETENGNGNGKWKRKTETESRKGKWSSQQYVHSTSYQCQDRSLSSKSRSASLGRCKTWTLDSGTHELTDIWTPDKTINDDMMI